MRPIYETDKDIKAQRDVADILESSWKCQAVSLPKLYPADYAMCRQDRRILSLVEIKCRPTVDSDDYATYMLSASKLIALDHIASSLNVPAILVVKWRDKIGYTDLTRRLAKTETFFMGGRYDRDDPDDLEPIVHIPLEDFKFLSMEAN